MFKSFLFITILFGVIFAALDSNSEEQARTVDLASSTAISRKNAKANEVILAKVSDFKNLKLTSNLSEQKVSFEMRDACKLLVNGGFYDTSYKHIGLFVQDFETISRFRDNNLLNGVLHFDEQSVGISKIVDSNYKYATQSGPIIKLDGLYANLAISNDKHARRMLAATDYSGDLYFIALVNKDSNLLGPRLMELADILADYENDTGIDFRSIINLDGGSASVFISDKKRIVESSIVGSFICLE